MRKITEKDWIPQSSACINEARPKGAGNTDEPLDIANLGLGGPTMPVDGNISTCGDSASEHNQNTWKSIGDVAARLAERNACHKGETAQAIAERKAGEVIFALDNDDLTGAAMATESLCKFFAEYAEACRNG